MLTTVIPDTPEALDAVRALCWDYLAFLTGLGGDDARVVTWAYPRATYAVLMDRLAEDHAPPSGGIRLALRGGAPVGCGMFRGLDAATAEIKRVYVTPQARGAGAGRALMLALIADIRAQGFRRILMDTGTPLTAARHLYLALGFRLRGPYRDLPEVARGRLLFFEMDLGA